MAVSMFTQPWDPVEGGTSPSALILGPLKREVLEKQRHRPHCTKAAPTLCVRWEAGGIPSPQGLRVKLKSSHVGSLGLIWCWSVTGKDPSFSDGRELGHNLLLHTETSDGENNFLCIPRPTE